MSDFPSDFAIDSSLLNTDGLDQAGIDAVNKLAERGFEVYVGLTKEIAEQIIQMAEEPAIREYCPNDCGKRFASLDATEQWLSKQRATFLLMKKSDEGQPTLAGYGWAGNGTSLHAPGGETTFAIRIGEVGQGQGLASSFAWLIVAGSAVLYNAKNFWLETWQSNGGAVHTYHKIGFQDVAKESAERPSASGETIPDTRLYMTLPNELLPKVSV